MPDQPTIERIQQEVVSANKAKLYERKKLLINTPEESPMQVDENGDTIRQMLGNTKKYSSKLSKETQDKMVKFIENKSTATLKDIIKEFFSK